MATNAKTDVKCMHPKPDKIYWHGLIWCAACGGLRMSNGWIKPRDSEFKGLTKP